MPDIDLIPNNYRYWLWQLRLLKGVAITIVLLVVIAVAGYGGVTYLVKEKKLELAQLQKEKAISTFQRESWQQLNDQKTELERQWGLLNGLRGGTTVRDILMMIDRAIVAGELWFVDWQFARSGVAVAAHEQTQERGYFIVVPRDRADSHEGEAWEIQTHLKIRGRALNHAALSSFVSRLLEQPKIFDVRILQTTQARNGNVSVVEFELAIMVLNLKRAA